MTHSRLTGVLLLTSLTAMVAGAVIVVPSGLTLNPADAALTLATVNAQTGLHLIDLGLDVIAWTALVVAALTMARQALLPAGLLAAAGLAGLLHDAGNLAVTQLAADPAAAPTAKAVLLTAKWTVNLAGLLWVAATATTALYIPMTAGLRRASLIAALCGFAAVILPWTTGTSSPSPTLEQLGYALHLPIIIWYGVLGWRDLRTP